MQVAFKDDSIKKIKIIEKISSFLPSTHKFLDYLPEPWRSRAILLGYKFGLINKVGYVKITGYTDDTFTKRTGQESITCNIIPNVGVTQIRDILAGTSSNLPKNIEFGTSTTTPAVGDTDLGAPLSVNDRLVATVTTPGSYELRFEVFITSTYGPARPYTINEFGLFADPEESGILIAHALVSPGHEMSRTNTAIATYGLLLR